MNLIDKLGKYGSDHIADTGAYTGTWMAIQMLEATVFTTITSPTRTDHGTVAGKTYGAGTIIFGLFTAITLASGCVEAYRSKQS